MLKCRDVAHQASAYIDRQQSLRQRLAVAVHLLMCGNCRAFVRHLRTAVSLYGRLPDEPAPAASDVDRIIDRVANDKP